MAAAGLIIIVCRPARHRHRAGRSDDVRLVTMRDGGDLRLFNGTVPPWPEAQRATGQGRATAAHLGVPFHFASPDEPGIDLPRWWDTQA